MPFTEGQIVILHLETPMGGTLAKVESVGIVNRQFAYVAGMRFRQADGHRSGPGARYIIVALTTETRPLLRRARPLHL